MRFPAWNGLPLTQVGIRVQNHNHRHLPNPRHNWHFRLNLKQNHSKRQETWMVSGRIGIGKAFFSSSSLSRTQHLSLHRKLSVNMVLAVSIFCYDWAERQVWNVGCIQLGLKLPLTETFMILRLIASVEKSTGPILPPHCEQQVRLPGPAIVCGSWSM